MANYLSIQEFAERTGYSPSDVKLMIKSGEIATFRWTPRANQWIPVSELEKFQKKNSEQPKQVETEPARFSRIIRGIK